MRRVRGMVLGKGLEMEIGKGEGEGGGKGKGTGKGMEIVEGERGSGCLNA